MKLGLITRWEIHEARQSTALTPWLSALLGQSRIINALELKLAVARSTRALAHAVDGVPLAIWFVGVHGDVGVASGELRDALGIEVVLLLRIGAETYFGLGAGQSDEVPDVVFLDLAFEGGGRGKAC